MVRNYQNADCSLKKLLFIPSFVIVFGTVGLSRSGVVLKKWRTPETRLRQRFLNNLGLHTRRLIHVRKIATADL